MFCHQSRRTASGDPSRCGARLRLPSPTRTVKATLKDSGTRRDVRTRLWAYARVEREVVDVDRVDRRAIGAGRHRRHNLTRALRRPRLAGEEKADENSCGTMRECRCARFRPPFFGGETIGRNRPSGYAFLP